VTLGPKGRNVVLETKYGSPKIVNDGVTVAKEVELEDPVENIGAKLVRQVGDRPQKGDTQESRCGSQAHDWVGSGSGSGQDQAQGHRKCGGQGHESHRPQYTASLEMAGWILVVRCCCRCTLQCGSGCDSSGHGGEPSVLT